VAIPENTEFVCSLDDQFIITFVELGMNRKVFCRPTLSTIKVHINK